MTFLAPNLLPLYEFIVERLANRLGVAVDLEVGTAYRQLDGVDLAFVCGLPYVEAVARGCPLEPVAAPVLHGERYAGNPIYFSDVVVRRDRPFQSFADLRGCSWSYNEPHSQSGHGVVCHHLAALGEPSNYFGRVIESGWHERSLEMVAGGEVDGSAIDSHVLAVALRDRPQWAERLKVIGTLGPSTIQPLVVRKDLPADVKAELRAIVVALHDDTEGRSCLDWALVERFVVVTDSDYDDIRRMARRAAAAGVNELC